MNVPSSSHAVSASCSGATGRPATREAELVELVDPAGGVTGTATVLDAHEAPGMLHRAFSVFLRRPDGRVLLQQRAAVKTRFPLRWGNTCCGHPVPGEAVAISAGRRLREELDVTAMPLREVGVYVYFAEDPVTGRVEREYDHVLLGDVPADVEVRPDPDEVATLRWVTVDDLLREIEGSPSAYAPWLEGVTRRLAAHLDHQPPFASGASSTSAGPSESSASSAALAITDSSATLPITDSSAALTIADSSAALPIADSSAALTIADSSAALTGTDSSAALTASAPERSGGK
ncbi:hypothetical protein Aph02nite_70270 [Actinoplanes philippinensis]|uniref:Isopentenyl-diphosphate Delta-isomerase n=1 Tax=Actinoplanes philippinensis TaxID=35752 RepID=A0A1I2KMA7_9ACTN|nr:hypothetical protein Aph02nite_70270 [Actinoplanes philippinensis]SFF66367.1 isopentenyl-diphosphate delta-isomerase, type 1 [Actinoplanes philippinensis]